MAGTERVVRAFFPAHEAGEAATAPDPGDAFTTPGEDLVRIRLVPDVPDDRIAR